jgi:hypothetical protein
MRKIGNTCRGVETSTNTLITKDVFTKAANSDIISLIGLLTNQLLKISNVKRSDVISQYINSWKKYQSGCLCKHSLSNTTYITVISFGRQNRVLLWTNFSPF